MKKTLGKKLITDFYKNSYINYTEHWLSEPAKNGPSLDNWADENPNESTD